MEEVGMAHFALDDGVLQGRHDMALTTDLPEPLGAVATVKRLIGHASQTLLLR